MANAPLPPHPKDPNTPAMRAYLEALSAGETNTGSNQGTDGVGVFDAKAGVDLQFRNIAPASNLVSVTLNGKDIDLDVVEGNLDLANMGGVLSVILGGTGQITYTDGEILIGATSGGTLVKAELTSSTGINIANGPGSITISTIDEQIDHDSLQSFVADEHVPHSGVSVIAGTGLSGGGQITADRTLTLDLATLNTDTTVFGTDLVAIDDGTTKSITFSQFESALTLSSIGGSVAVNQGGTGQSSYTDGQLLIGNTSTGVLDKATLLATNGLTVTSAAGAITVNGVTATTSFGSPGVASFFASDFVISGGEVSIKDTGIDHDATTNFVANEHIDWTSTSSNLSTSGTAAAGILTASNYMQAGNIKVTANSIISQDVNGNINLVPSGSGSVVVDTIIHPQADGTARQILETNGSGQLSFVNPDWVLLSSQTASASASVDFTSLIDSTYDVYVFVGMNLIPANETSTNNQLMMRMARSGTFDSTAGDYAWVFEWYKAFTSGNNGLESSGSDAEIELSGTANEVGGASGEGAGFIMYVVNPSSSSFLTQTYGSVFYFNESQETMTTQVLGVHRYVAAVDGVQFLYRGANISSGDIYMYALNKS